MRTMPQHLDRLVCRIAFATLAFLSPALAAADATQGETPIPAARVLELDHVWSGHPVGFDWLRHDDLLIVAYYDADRHLTVASRRLTPDLLDPAASSEPIVGGWTVARLPTTLGWDSHNSIEMARDADGRLHLCGNMHAVPLVYFRTDRADDVTSFVPLHRMIGDRESRCTYPSFFRGPNGTLLFSYRDGASGRGDLLINAYDPPSKTWRRLIDGPLLDGEGDRNAYPFGPTRGPDERYHLGWVWRDTPDCATNHDISYARSRDLIHWENAAGEPLPTPIRLSSPAIVDPVAVRGGLLNFNNAIAFDSQGRPILTYHKYDADGNIQAYTARFEDDIWKIRAASSWDSRWDFSGGGSIQADLTLGPLSPAGNGRFAIPFKHWREGSGRLLLDGATLEPVPEKDGPPAASSPTPRSPGAPSPRDVLSRREGTDPALRVHLMMMPGPGGSQLALRWETLGPNRDRPRTGPIPPPSPLRLYIFPRETR